MSNSFETHEKIAEHAHTGSPRWIPIAAAILAVFAAVATLLASLRSTQANLARSDAIIATTRMADAYNEYESRSIKQHIYEAAIDASGKPNPKLQGIADHEKSAKRPVFDKAKAFEADVEHARARSEKMLAAQETLEVAATLFEVAIVLVSISTFTRGRLLPTLAAISATAGLAIFITGALR